MARYSEARDETGKYLAAMLAQLAKHLAKGNKAEIMARDHAALAVASISGTDISELSRREIYGNACVMSALAKVQPGKFSPAIAAYAESLVQFSKVANYPATREYATQAIALAQAATARAKARA